MEENIKEIMSIHKQLVKRMASFNGSIWKEVAGEVQSQYNEIVYWILLFDDSDLQIAHSKFCKITEPNIHKIYPLQIALFYYMITEDKVYCIDRLIGNETVFSAMHDGELGSNGYPMSNDARIFFKSTDSKRETTQHDNFD